MLLTNLSRDRTRQAGASIVEIIVTLAVTLLVAAAFSSFLYAASLSLTSVYTYATIDTANQQAINLMTREIRLARRVVSLINDSLTIENTNGVAVTYAYQPSQRAVVRSDDDSTTVMLRDCESVRFTLGKAQPANTFEDFVPATSVAEAKIVDFSWRCSKRVSTGAAVASDDLASAKIVIRNHGK